MKNELVTGDLVLARIGGEYLALEFYGWWDDHRRVCTLVSPSSGKTFFSAIHQIVCIITEENVRHLNPSYLRRAHA